MRPICFLFAVTLRQHTLVGIDGAAYIHRLDADCGWRGVISQLPERTHPCVQQAVTDTLVCC